MQFLAKLAGHNFRPTECKVALAEVHMGQAHALHLRRDPENQYDENAVKVILTLDGSPEEYFIGFIEKGIAEQIAPLLDNKAPDTLVAPDHAPVVTECRILDFVSGPKAPTILIEITTGFEIPTQVGETSPEDSEM